MALNVAWRWSMPQVASPNAQADDMAAGIQGFTQGLGKMIADARRVRREDEQRQQAQANWQATFDQNKAQADQAQANWEAQMAQNKAQQALAQENWQKTYEMQKALNDLNIETQQGYRDWLKGLMTNSLMGGYANEDEYQKLLRIYGGDNQANARAVMLGLDPNLL